MIDKRGHVVDPIQLDQIQVGVTTKEQVATLLGTPSSVATFGDRTWFYISETTQRRAFLSPTILKSNVTRIEFTPLGKVSLVDSDKLFLMLHEQPQLQAIPLVFSNKSLETLVVLMVKTLIMTGQVVKNFHLNNTV